MTEPANATDPDTTPNTGAAVRCERLVKIHRVGESEVVALQGLDIMVDPGEMVGVIGASGSGKSTLLNVLGGLLRLSAGSARIDDLDLGTATDADLDQHRRDRVGFVWQQSSRNLVPHLSAIENVELPMTFAGRRSNRARSGSAAELLDLVGMTHRARHRPVELSGGEQQRVAIAVALANRPTLLLADEPTGELDTGTAAEIFELLRDVRTETGLTQIIVSHDADIAHQVDRVVAVQDGQLASEFRASVSRAGGATHAAGLGDPPALEELLIVDTLGRIRLDPAHRAALGIGDRVKAELRGDHVALRPVDAPSNREETDT